MNHLLNLMPGDVDAIAADCKVVLRDDTGRPDRRVLEWGVLNAVLGPVAIRVGP